MMFRCLRRKSAAEKIKHKSGAGFTLTEMILAMAIFAILFGVTVYDYRIAQRHDDLKQAAVSLMTYLREMQNIAMTGVAITTGVPYGGYGVHVDKGANAYTLFGDWESFNGDNVCVAAANGRYDRQYCLENPGRCECLYQAPNDEPVPPATVTLPRNVVIYQITTDGCVGGACSADVSFRPPKPRPYVGADDEPLNPANALTAAQQGRTITIILRHEDTERCRKVTAFGPSGQISEEQDTATAGCEGVSI